MTYYDISGELKFIPKIDLDLIVQKLVDSVSAADATAQITAKGEIQFTVSFQDTVTRGFILQGISSGSITVQQTQLNEFSLTYRLITLPMRVVIMFLVLFLTVAIIGVSIDLQTFLFTAVGLGFSVIAYFMGKFAVHEKFKSFIRRSILNHTAGIIHTPFRLPGNTFKVVAISCLATTTLGLLIPAFFALKVIQARSGILWSQPIGGAVTSAPIISGNNVYFGSVRNTSPPQFFSLDASSGEFRWVVPLSSSVFLSPVETESMVYFATDDGYYFALDKITGEKVWEFSPQQRNLDQNTCGDCALKLSQAIFYSGVIYFGSLDHNLYALDAHTGAMLWHLVTGGSILSAPSVENSQIYVGSTDGYVYAVDASSGTEIQRYYLPNKASDNQESGVTATPVIDASMVYALNGSLNAVDMTTGQIKWVFTNPSTRNRMIDVILEYNELLIVPTTDAIMAVNKSNGEIQWKFDKIIGRIFSSPTLDNGSVYFGDSSGYLYFIDAQIGRRLRQYSMNLTDLSSLVNWTSEFVFQPAIDDDAIILGWYDRLYAIRNNN